jgi:hypothetical protein
MTRAWKGVATQFPHSGFAEHATFENLQHRSFLADDPPFVVMELHAIQG